MTKVLVVGETGQLGRAITRNASELGWKVTSLGRTVLDLANPLMDLRPHLNRVQPDLVVNAAAYTQVDKAEEERDLAYQVNGTAPGNLAKACFEAGIPFHHVSTDYVFDGLGGAPYAKDAKTNPLSVYGASKLAGERAVADANPDAVIARTSWVFEQDGKNFPKAMIALAPRFVEKGFAPIVSDQRGRPTRADDLARGLRQLFAHRAPGGLYHVCNSGEASWAEVAIAVFEAMQAKGLAVPSVKPIPTTDYPTPARRPLDTRLELTALPEFQLTHWKDALDQCLQLWLAA